MEARWRWNDRRPGGQRDAIRAMSSAGSTCPVMVMFLVAFLVASPARPPWGGQVETLPGATMLVNGVPLRVEVARSPEAQQRGLGYRNGLANNTGMLFVYDEAAAHTFWMKGMRFCLDIVWVERNTIVGAAESICPAPAGTSDAAIPRAQAPEPVHDVLEVRAGWLAAHGVGVGSRVMIHLDEPAR
jgi:uncharacterized membrane protein (UPF0127 family)